MNLEGRGSSVIASKHQSKETRPKSAVVPQNSRTEEDSYDDEEFESGGSPRLSSTRTTPRQSWMESEHEMIDMSTQTVVHSGELLCNHLMLPVDSPLIRLFRNERETVSTGDRKKNWPIETLRYTISLYGYG